MPNHFGAPEISVRAVADKLTAGEEFVLLDVRERRELDWAKLDDARVVVAPLSELAARQAEALPEPLADKETQVVVFCHTGVRSAQVTAWLRQQGWANVFSMDGGIDAYARQVDPSVGMY